MTGRGLLLSQLEWIAGNCCRLMAQVKPEDLGWRPRDGMRSVAEVANHLAQIPAIDLLIIKSAGEIEVQEAERELFSEAPEKWCETMKSGLGDLSRFMEILTMAEYENGSSTAFYGRTQTFAQWLLEVITHMYHHRAQLFTYLKQLGYPVDTRTLYS